MYGLTPSSALSSFGERALHLGSLEF